MQEKAWSTGGLKKLILKLIGENAYCYRKAKHIVIGTENVGNTDYSFEPVRIGKFFISNKTKKWTAFAEPIYQYDTNTYVYKLYSIDYANFANSKIIIINSTKVINTLSVNATDIENFIALSNTDFPYDNNDEIEIIYENVIYGYSADI